MRHEGSAAVGLSCHLVIGCSGRLARKAAGARAEYNAAAADAEAALAEWHTLTGRTHDTTLAMALASSSTALAQLVGALGAASAPTAANGCARPSAGAGARARIAARVEQFALESNELAPAALRALADGDMRALGVLAAHSHLAGDSALGNQVGETRALVALARTLGAHAASAFGAGFGGAVWAWVDAAGADTFAREWARAYAAEPGVSREAVALSAFFATPLGPGAFELSPVVL